MNQQQMKQKNLDALGAAGVQRIAAVSTWLKSIAGKDGVAVADFITQFPSAPIVRSLETVIRRFSNQGGADFSQSHRASQEDPGKIPGYENMSFAQKRAAQMAQMMSKPGYRGGTSDEVNDDRHPRPRAVADTADTGAGNPYFIYIADDSAAAEGATNSEENPRSHRCVGVGEGHIHKRSC